MKKYTIREIVESNGIEYRPDMRRDGDIITEPAPAGEPRRYNRATNTGGRRYVCSAVK